jgi:hypothetical protein
VPALFENLFIVTYGRSGSTLLQGLMNSIPGYLIRGENDDLVGQLLQTRNKLLRRHKPIVTLSRAAWYGRENFRDEVLLQPLRGVIDAVLLTGAERDTVRCYGFKEIRYPLPEVEDKVNFLRTLYPRAAFIFNTRDPKDVVQSDFQIGKPVEEFEALNAEFGRLATMADSFLIAYEDVVSRNDNLRHLFQFLDEPFDAAAVDAVVMRRHGFHAEKSPFGNADPFHIKLEDRTPFDKLRIHSVEIGQHAVKLTGTMALKTGFDLALVTTEAAQITVEHNPSSQESGPHNFCIHIEGFAGDAIALNLGKYKIFTLRNLDIH